MPPAKSKTANHDDSKSETPSVKERNGHGANKDHGHQTNGKLRRVASSTGSTLRDATKATTNGHPPVTAEPPAAQPAAAPALHWPAFDREVLHEYRHPESAFTPPTMARKSEYRRQTKEDLAKVVRKHFNGQGIQENEIVVGFLHRVRNPAIARPKRNKLAPHASPMP
ncbi:hypothetical protein PG993_002611 [Apiospora rasikravindrae]|uniref:Histone deacetylase complex subunit SAP30 Sin3 binding domain-containing protein n=1 Tax=Apiospora rasikravindrae TaxID=990691 RepID=A0ABR1TX47_9PEZI